MDSTTTAMMQAYFARAVRRMAAAETAHEALYEACSVAMKWLEPAHDLPPRLRVDFEAWRQGLLIGDAYSSDNSAGALMRRLRDLQLHQARQKVDDLVKLAIVVHEQ